MVLIKPVQLFVECNSVALERELVRVCVPVYGYTVAMELCIYTSIYYIYAIGLTLVAYKACPVVFAMQMLVASEGVWLECGVAPPV